MTPTYISSATVAVMIGLDTANAFLTRRKGLERQHGFPLPMPHSRRPLIWRREQIADWVGRQGVPAQIRIPVIPGSNVVLMAEARRA